MTAFAFRPVWDTNPGIILTTTEAASVSTALSARVASTINGNAGETTFDAGPQAALVDTVLVNGASVPFAVSGSNIVLSTPLVNPSTVEAVLNVTPTIALLNGSLPVGLTLTNGLISGTVGFTPGNNIETFVFTVRASYSGYVRDRQFQIVVEPLTTLTVDWNYGALPAVTLDPDTNISSRHLGDLYLGSAIVFQPSVEGLGDTPSFAIGEMGVSTSTTVFDGILPLGLTFDPTTGKISGVVSASATPGYYYFTLSMVSDNAPEPLELSFRVIEEIAETVEALDSITWITPAGSLGTVIESYPCHFRIEAVNALGTHVAYSIQPGSSMPPGLVLDPLTGEIRGKPLHIAATTVYEFTIRASTALIYSDRTFQITVQNRYDKEAYTFGIRMPNTERAFLWSRYADIIPQKTLFRPNDANFGLVTDPVMYLVGGIDGTELIILDQYHTKLKLVLGNHKIAKVRNAAGQVVYEVLYREVFDPMERAGGFSVVNNEPVEIPVQYPQNPIYTVYPNSLHNLRLDIIDDYKFATNNPAYRESLGAEGIEALPEWMTSPQVANDPNSILGYVPAFVVAYLKPSMGDAVLLALNTSGVDWRVGYELNIDRYFVVAIELGSTTFDGGKTTFDTTIYGSTTFDTIVIDDGKYYHLKDRSGIS